MQFKSDRIKYTLSLSGYEGKTITGRLTLFSPNSVKLAFKQRLSQRVLVKGEEQKEIHVGLLQVKQR